MEDGGGWVGFDDDGAVDFGNVAASIDGVVGDGVGAGKGGIDRGMAFDEPEAGLGWIRRFDRGECFGRPGIFRSLDLEAPTCSPSGFHIPQGNGVETGHEGNCGRLVPIGYLFIAVFTRLFEDAILVEIDPEAEEIVSVVRPELVIPNLLRMEISCGEGLVPVVPGDANESTHELGVACKIPAFAPRPLGKEVCAFRGLVE